MASSFDSSDPREHIARSIRESAELRVRLAETHTEVVYEAARAVAECLGAGGKLLVFGNGGSAADAQHIAAEFVGRFERERRALPAIALTVDTSALTAIANDYGFEQVFARQVRALGRAGDVAFAISTSGRSPNVLLAVEAARELGMTVIGLTGRDGGPLAAASDIAVNIPSPNTARIQECHLMIEHLICETVERLMFNDE